MTVNITSTADGKQVAHEEETVVRIRPTLSFTDGQVEGFDKLMTGVKAGDKRSAKVDAHRGCARTSSCAARRCEVEFEVLEVKQLKLPELTAEFLQEIGDFDTEEELRKAIRQNLERQLEYQQQRDVRGQITALLDQERRLATAAGAAGAAECPRAGAGRDGTAAERVQRGGDPRPRELAAAEQQGLDRRRR